MITCKYCNKNFTHKKYLKTHLINKSVCKDLFENDKLWLDSVIDEKHIYKCRFCNREFTSNTSRGSHYKKDEPCSSKYYDEKAIDNKSKTKVICKICGKELRNISNTHLKKHSITQQEYKKLYPNDNIFADGLLKLQRDKREATLHERYTDDELRYLKGQKSMDSRLKNDPNLENYKKFCKERGLSEQYRAFMSSIMQKVIQTDSYKESMRLAGLNMHKYWENLKNKDEIAYFKLRSDITEKRKQTCIQLYGVPFAQQAAQSKLKQKQTLIENYGSLDIAYYQAAKKSVDTRLARGMLNFCPMYSLESQTLFQAIEKELISKNFNIFYATNGNKLKNSNEYRVRVESESCLLRFLDFYIKDLNVAIEFDEDHHFTEENIEKDKIREEEIKVSIPDIHILHITKKEYLESFDKTFSKCLNFILTNSKK